jgi:predicted ATPase
LEEHVAHWLRELGLISEFKVEELAAGSNTYTVRVKRSAGSAEVLLTDVGFGVSQVLPVLALLFYVPAGSTIMLEHPEIHLHPAVQSGLADVLIDAINVNQIQVVIESHSEHLLRRLQRRVAERKFGEEQTALYFCGNKDGGSYLEKLEMNNRGAIANWPDDFFGDMFDDVVETELAAAQGAGGR